MIDPLISLAFALQSNKGVYALLLGSGVSRDAGIFTGWEIVLALVKKLAHMQGEDCGEDAAAWYQEKIGEEPNYSKLLDALAKSREERQQLLRIYFEPNEDEREQRLKVPTAAHRSVAELVARGYVRVIVTTNFDRLIERAIEDEGITPTVISTSDGIEGALPLIHQQCCVFKVHGDYLDTRIKNSPQELEKYDCRVNKLLDRILDEFGLIVSGWSADWDAALRSAFERCKSRRFTLYWAARGDLKDAAARLVKMRAGTVIPIKSADSFFRELSEKVLALEDMQRPHPLSVAAAAATVKRLLSEDRHRIRLHDLVRDETERTFLVLCELHQQESGERRQHRSNEDVFDYYFISIAILREIMIHGCRWANPSQFSIFSQCIPQLARDPDWKRSGSKTTSVQKAAPAAMLFYAGGVSAVAGCNYGMFAHLMTQTVCRSDGKEGPFVHVFDWNGLHRFASSIPESCDRYAADSRWLFRRLREPLRPLIPDDAEYEVIFDRFEYLRGLVYADMELQQHEEQKPRDLAAPVGLFHWRQRHDGHRALSIQADVASEIEAMGDQWEPLIAGLFGGSLERIKVAIHKYDEALAQRSYY